MSGSVFRRQGQKTEVQGKPNEVHFDQEQLQQKLEELQKTLSVPLAAYVTHPVHLRANVLALEAHLFLVLQFITVSGNMAPRVPGG